MEYLAVSQMMIDSGLLILIWLVQLIIYPSFRHTEADSFITWHARYTRLISLFVVPLVLIQAGIEFILFFFQAPRWLRISIIAVIWVSTFKISVPCHKQLQAEGKAKEIMERLVRTNWIRTILWSILFLDTAIKAY